MKKLILIFCVLIACTNVSYSSFPITENHKKETVEETISKSIQLTTKKSSNIYVFSAFLSFFLALIFIMLMVVGMTTWSISGPTIAKYISYAILSSISALIFAIIAIVKRNKNKSRYY